MKSVSISEFQKHRNNETQTLLKGPQEILPAFSTLVFRVRDTSVLEASKKKLLSDCGFHDNRCNESHTLFTGVNKFLSVLSTFIIHKLDIHGSVYHDTNYENDQQDATM
jgi:hypothetical protein